MIKNDDLNKWREEFENHFLVVTIPYLENHLWDGWIEAKRSSQLEIDSLKTENKKAIKALSNIITAYSNGEHVDTHWIKDEIGLQASGERLLMTQHHLEKKKLQAENLQLRALVSQAMPYVGYNAYIDDEEELEANKEWLEKAREVLR
jgi:hypothetical protein